MNCGLELKNIILITFTKMVATIIAFSILTKIKHMCNHFFKLKFLKVVDIP